MEDLFSYYEINEKTTALIQYTEENLKTIALEPNKQIYVREKPQRLIEGACLSHFATYEGRRDAVTRILGIQEKIPIPINPTLNLYAFPTHAVDDEKCCWIFYTHVLNIHPNPLTKEPSSKITFVNGEELILPVSAYFLQKQMKSIEFLVKTRENNDVFFH